jgi:DNA-binding response OmpR family regulator
MTKTALAAPTVLVVDDEANYARVVAIGLRFEGFDVETAEDADTALRQLADRPFELALLDLMMPGTSGITLARIVRERHPMTRVVLTSAYHLSERQLQRVDCGAVGFVPKPCDLTDLAQFLRGKLPGGDPADDLGGTTRGRSPFAIRVAGRAGLA